MPKRVKFKIPALPSQRRFYESAAKFKGFSGPVGSGKTYALCYEALRLSNINPGRRGLLGAPTFPMLRDVTITTMLEILEDKRIPYRYFKQAEVLLLKRTGSKIFFRPLDHFERLRGTNLAWYGIDEMTFCKREAWERLEARLRDPRAAKLQGFGVWTPNGFDWVYKRFINPKTRLAGYDAVIAAPGENMAVLSKNPDFYEVLKASYDENFYRQEVLGEYLNIFAGRVYHAFSEDRNEDEKIRFNPEHEHGLSWALDFNVDPMGTVLCQQFHNKSRVNVLREFTLKNATTYKMCEMFEAETADLCTAYRNAHGGRSMPVHIYGDATSEKRSTTAAKSDYDQIKEFFRARNQFDLKWHILSSNPRVKDRVNSMNANLCNAHGQTRLFIHPDAKELVTDLYEVSYLQDGFEIDKKKDRKRTHWSDALGYLIYDEWRLEGFQREVITN